MIKHIYSLQQKQKLILEQLLKINKDNINQKVHSELSPLGWHILHCIFVEATWIRSYFFSDDTIVNKFKNLADATKITVNKRHLGLPDVQELKTYAKTFFRENIFLIKKLSSRKIKKKYSINYIINFLNQHHSQHIEIMKAIVNLHNLNFNKNFNEYTQEIVPKEYKFSGIEIPKGIYKVGAKKTELSFDNENPRHEILLENYTISNKLISISEWLAFIRENGYKRKKFWSSHGWDWRTKNNITSPMNWVFKNKYNFSLSTPNGYITPKKNMPVSNISKYELEAFASWNKMRIPHEFEWEVSSKRLTGKFKVWEWSANEFFGYKNFKPYPYKEYSYPWFKDNYFTLKGGSIFSLKDIKRNSFRNFYKPSTRYIFAGGRLCA